MKTIAILGALQGIMLGMFILSKQTNKLANKSFLVGVLLTIVHILLVAFVENPNQAEGIIGLKLLTWIIPFTVPVFAYFYFSFLVGERKKYILKDLVHGIPTLLAIVAVIPYIWLASKSGPVWLIVNPTTFTNQGLIHLFFYSFVICYYGSQVTIIYINFKRKMESEYANLEEKQLGWIQGNGIAIFIIGISGLAMSLYQIVQLSQPGVSPEELWTPHFLVFIPISVLFYWYTYKVMQVPELFLLVEPTHSINPGKYAHSQLSKSQMAKIGNQLSEFIENGNRYTDPRLNLTQVASELSISNQILSQVINQHFEQNFFEFVNAYRLSAAKKKLKDPNLKHLSIQGIAQEAGFKSKSTFYDLFKKETGLTPRQFQKT